MMREVFGINEQQVGLLITVFTVPGIILTPVLGVFADRVGRKWVLVPCLFLFSIAGTACGFAPSFTILLVLRFFQGVGAAALGALNVTIIGDLFQGRERITAMGLNASVLSVGTATYPAVGGILAAIAWNYPFFLPILVFPLAILVAFKLKTPEPETAQPIGEYLREVFKEIFKREPLVLFAASMVIFVILYGAYLTYLPLLLSDVFAVGPSVIGLMMTLTSISSAIMSSQLGRISLLLSQRRLAPIGLCLFGILLVILPFVKELWQLGGLCLLLGAAFAFSIPVVQTIISSLAPHKRRAAFMSINGMVLRMGQATGPLLAGLLFAWRGFYGVFFVNASIAFAMALALVIFLKPKGA
jgi:MFS family permease